ncbi:MAG: DNA gyrase subunit A [Alphaproteobacteria bacterium]|nr:MAG: DNA gyrase subunit A [Alphaproteobacteria bacterium]
MSDDTEEPAGEETPRLPHDGPSISVEEEMRRSYLDYAMSVIVARAIPDVRDGLKPVHRRILYAMHEVGNTHDKPYRKSSRPVSDAMGKYHPHGDAAIYDALVRMAQPFSMRLPLLDGQGNFGSMDGDPPAAFRYTEVRMAEVANYLLADIDRDTVDFQPNYDGQDEEPVVLPARFPNILVNGAGGIAVGMATNIPPHNLGEVIDATLALIENPDLTSLELMRHVPGPDFPTGGVILGQAGAKKAYVEGRGSVLLRAKTRVEEIRKDRHAIIVEEIPYQVNKASLIEKIAELARDKRIEGIAHVQDESDRFGVRVVIELRRDATPEVVLNQLFRFTQLQTSFGCNMLALHDGRPEQMTLRGFLTAFLAFREEVVARRTAFELRRARERAHVLCGLAVAVDNVDEVVRTIRASPDPASARAALMERAWPAENIAGYLALIDDPAHRIREDGTYFLSETQARAILDLRLQRLTALGVREVGDELEVLAERITDYLDILRSRERILAIISAELAEVKEKFATPRRTEIGEFEGEVEDEDLIEREDMVVTITAGGYIKRTALDAYREQRRGGKGAAGMNTKGDDVVTNLFVANTHTPLLVFTTDGMVYSLKTWRLPLAARNARGKALVNILPIQPGVSIAAIMPVDRPEEEWDDLQIVFATSAGHVRRNALSDFTHIMRNGKIAMRLPEGETLINARICSESDDVLMTTAQGKAIRFPVTDVRVFKGRDSTGVRGIRLAPGDRVVSMAVLRHVEATPEERAAYLKMSRAVSGEEGEAETADTEAGGETTLSQERYVELSAQEEFILVILSNGAGKRTSAYEYRITGRGGQGITAADLSPRRGRPGGHIVASFPVEEDDQIMLVTNTGQSIRCPVREISRQGRSAGGVRVFDTAEGEEVVSVALIAEHGEEEEDAAEE